LTDFQKNKKYNKISLKSIWWEACRSCGQTDEKIDRHDRAYSHLQMFSQCMLALMPHKITRKSNHKTILYIDSSFPNLHPTRVGIKISVHGLCKSMN